MAQYEQWVLKYTNGLQSSNKVEPIAALLQKLFKVATSRRQQRSMQPLCTTASVLSSWAFSYDTTPHWGYGASPDRELHPRRDPTSQHHHTTVDSARNSARHLHNSQNLSIRRGHQGCWGVVGWSTTKLLMMLHPLQTIVLGSHQTRLERMHRK